MQAKLIARLQTAVTREPSRPGEPLRLLRPWPDQLFINLHSIFIKLEVYTVR